VPIALAFQYVQWDCYPVYMMYHILEVAVSGFSAWSMRTLCHRQREGGETSQHIKCVITQHCRVCDSPLPSHSFLGSLNPVPFAVF